MGTKSSMVRYHSSLYSFFDMRRLTIISHTEHYVSKDGTIVGLGSTVTELNHLLEVFDHITHIAMLHSSSAPANALPYVSGAIELVPIPAVGGPDLSDKLLIIKNLPKIIGIIHRHIKSADYFQFRAPTGIGVFVIPYLRLFHKGKGWYKYAGNWKQTDAPLAYRFQKWLLTHQSRKVTINGFWKAQPEQCLSFENPCLTQEELVAGVRSKAYKTLNFPIDLCFVGRLEAAKGIDLIFDALAGLSEGHQKKIGTLHLVGDGAQRVFYQTKADSLTVKVHFHGVLSREAVHAIYKTSHALLLPSASEGFPKVIAEAMNYGCIPIVSNVSAIGHYIEDQKNGFLLNALTVAALINRLESLLSITQTDFDRMTHLPKNFIGSFSYSHYNQRLIREIL